MTVYAYVPEHIEQVSLHDITNVDDVVLSQVFFGELTGMPHTYEFVLDETRSVVLSLRTPPTASSTNSVSGIIIKVPRKGRVEEVARLIGHDASWSRGKDDLTHDTYLQGPSYSGELTPGTYRVEVHTPDNMEKYMLVIGTDERMTIGYFELLGRMLTIKDFYEVSRFTLVTSPYVYIPLVCLIFMSGGVWYAVRRRVQIH